MKALYLVDKARQLNFKLLTLSSFELKDIFSNCVKASNTIQYQTSTIPVQNWYNTIQTYYEHHIRHMTIQYQTSTNPVQYLYNTV